MRFLKVEAKRRLQAGEFTGLHEAQLAVAREHGFSSSGEDPQEKIMISRLNPYLNFDGTARLALEFYAGVFGGEPVVSTFAQFGAEGPDGERVMHGQLETPAGYTIMAADVPGSMLFQAPAGFAVSLNGDDADALHA